MAGVGIKKLTPLYLVGRAVG